MLTKSRASLVQNVSQLLVDWGQGDQEAREALIPLVYGELRRLARHYLWRERPDHTLQSAALVHEAYLRLVRQETPQWQNRAHFFGVAAQLMRHILVDHARNHLAAKRDNPAHSASILLYLHAGSPAAAAVGDPKFQSALRDAHTASSRNSGGA